MNIQDIPSNGRSVALLGSNAVPFPITAAITGTTPGNGGANGVAQLPGLEYAGLVAVFTYGSGGTTAKFWVQTSFDGGTTWLDVANFAFTTATLTKVLALSANVAATPATPTDAALADNTINNGLLGDRLRIKATTTGTYAGGTTVKIVGILKG